MTCAELIARLQQEPPDREVKMEDAEWGDTTINSIEIKQDVALKPINKVGNVLIYPTYVLLSTGVPA